MNLLFPYERPLEGLTTIGIGRFGNIMLGPVRNRVGWKGCAEAHRRAAEHASMMVWGSPILILESDATAVRQFSEEVIFPAGADAVWLGLSCYGAGEKSSTWEDVAEHPELVRLTNMLATHAVALVSERFTEFYMKAATDPEEPFDLILARAMPDFNVFAHRRPFFVQGPETNHNYVATAWEIGPPP